MDLLELGSRVQAWRTDRGWTLQDLAEAASVSAGMLSAVERGQKAATIVVLARIADGLGVPLAELVTTAQRVVLRRASDQEVVEERGWRRTMLSPVVPGVNFEWVRTELPGGCDAGTFPAYAPGSHEYVVVESGVLQLTVGDAVHRLDAGDSAYFAADAPHGYANPGTDPCSYHVAALIMRPRRPRY